MNGFCKTNETQKQMAHSGPVHTQDISVRNSHKLRVSMSVCETLKKTETLSPQAKLILIFARLR